jgi:hypothetical protein
MAEPDRKARKRLRDLHARLGSSNEGERASALRKIDAWLRKHGKTWNDVPELLHDETRTSAYADPRDAEASEPVGTTVTPLDIVSAMLQDYVILTSHEYVAGACWIVHTHVYDQFMVTPRLVLISPVRACGKTTLLDVASHMVARPEKSDNTTAAAIYHAVDEDRCTLLIDEADNLELSAKGALRAVLNSGHRKGGSIMRLMGRRRRRFSTFAPVAMASIGALTLPLMSRSIVIPMARHNEARSLKRFDTADTAILDLVYGHLFAWAKRITLNLDPEMPSELRGRLADNWRPLIAVADACSPAWGVLTREAAVVFSKSYQEEDIIVVLLQHIRDVFDAHGVDRLFSRVLVRALNEMDDAPWSEWRGLHDDQQPRRLSQGELARLLKPFGIRPRSIWPLGHHNSAKGYFRHQFESTWRSYCDDTDAAGGTPSQASVIKRLRGA